MSSSETCTKLEIQFRQRASDNAKLFKSLMLDACKQSKYLEALDYASKSLLLNPDDDMVRSFKELLEEKVELDADSDSDGDDDGDEEGDDGDASRNCDGDETAAVTDEESDTDDDEDEDEDEDDAEGSDIEDISEADTSQARLHCNTIQGSDTSTSSVMQEPTKLVVDERCFTTSRAERDALRQALKADIKHLREQMLIASSLADDPLLSA